VDERLALILYKQGFRSLDEIAEASEHELASNEGLGGMEHAVSLKRRAESTMERLRRRQIDEAAIGMRVFSEKDLLQLVKGVTKHVVELLSNAGYRTIRDLGVEEDVDRLAIKTGLGIRRAKNIREGIVEYLRDEASRVEEGQVMAQERAAAQEAAAREAARTATSESDGQGAVTQGELGKTSEKQFADPIAEASLAPALEVNDRGELKA
jgi:N utilization substance protein A